MYKSYSYTKLAVENGFTLIELVVVIVILGVLSATALPKFIDLSSEARAAATSGIAGGISSSSAINYAGRKVDATKGMAISTCTDASNLMQGGLPTGYSIAVTPPIPAETTVNCLLLGPGSTSALVVVTGVN